IMYHHRELVEYFLGYKLSQRNYPSSLLRPNDGDGGAEGEQRSPAVSNSLLVRRNKSAGIMAVKAAKAEDFGRLFAQTFGDFSPQIKITSYQNFQNVMDETLSDRCVEKDEGNLVCHISQGGWMKAAAEGRTIHMNLRWMLGGMAL
uniref:Apoptosis regulator Bcl-2 family BH4 domain-containing protein n=1 Tax=Takifugu rubripes TaxID=31033 RepID=A0A674NX62_TAKRU